MRMKMTRPWTIRAPQEAARQREGDRLPDIHIQPPTMLALSRGGMKTGGLEQHLSTGETLSYTMSLLPLLNISHFVHQPTYYVAYINLSVGIR
jgi:hypothetical protein